MRAARVLDAISAVDSSSSTLHLVGHSTGGLDARLAISPSADLPSDADISKVYNRIASVVTVSTPHGGSPLASFFASSAGTPLLRLLTSLAAMMVHRGAIPIKLITKFVAVVRSVDDIAGLRETALDELYRDVLKELDEERRALVKELFEEIRDDASLLIQLTPAATDLLEAATGDPPDTRYGCVVTKAPAASIGNVWEHKHDIYAQALHALYFVFSFLAARGAANDVSDEEHASKLADAFGALTHRDNDGIVPTLAQLWGELIHAVEADHFDITGHFGHREQSDWLPSNARFDSKRFEAVWRKVAEFQMGA